MVRVKKKTGRMGKVLRGCTQYGKCNPMIDFIIVIIAILIWGSFFD